MINYNKAKEFHNKILLLKRQAEADNKNINLSESKIKLV